MGEKMGGHPFPVASILFSLAPIPLERPRMLCPDIVPHGAPDVVVARRQAVGGTGGTGVPSPQGRRSISGILKILISIIPKNIHNNQK